MFVQRRREDGWTSDAYMRSNSPQPTQNLQQLSRYTSTAILNTPQRLANKVNMRLSSTLQLVRKPRGLAHPDVVGPDSESIPPLLLSQHFLENSLPTLLAVPFCKKT